MKSYSLTNMIIFMQMKQTLLICIIQQFGACFKASTIKQEDNRLLSSQTACVLIIAGGGWVDQRKRSWLRFVKKQMIIMWHQKVIKHEVDGLIRLYSCCCFR